MKITGAAAGKKYSFERCVELGRGVNAQVVSIGSALDHCHVPGRQRNEAVPRDVAIVGAGIHNEPVSSGEGLEIGEIEDRRLIGFHQGAQKLSPFPTVENLIQFCLKLLCDPNDAERYFVEFQPGDETVLVVNNYGGMSNLELGALTDETIIQLSTLIQS